MRRTPEVLFETPRLVARRLDADDADALHAVYGDRDAMRWVGDGEPLDLARCCEWIGVTQRNYATRGYGMYALAGRVCGRVVGFCGLVHPGGQVEAELKYAFERASWGQGLASEAAAAMLDAARSRLGLHLVIATAAEENVASHRVLEKAGMRLAGVDGGTWRFEWRANA